MRREAMREGEDGGRRGVLRVQARSLRNLVGGHARLGGHGVEREGRERGGHRVEPVAVRLDERAVDQPLVHDDLEHPADKRQVGSRIGAQPQVGVARQFRLARVDDDETLLAGADGLLDGHGEHVLLLRYVGADDEDAGGVARLLNRRRARIVAEHVVDALHQAWPVVGGGVHVVGLHGDAGELLGEVELLVGVARRGDEGELGALVPRQALCRRGDSLVPARGLKASVAPHQRLLDALAGVDVLEAEFALVAGVALIGGAVQLADGAYHLAEAVDLVGELAPDGTLGADALLVVGRALPLVLRLHKRAHGADVDAQAAELAARFQQRFAARGSH